MSQRGRRVVAGRYRLVDQLGRGGMGTIWRAQDDVLGREVAVKETLLPQGLDDDRLALVRDRTMREARAAAQIRHPGVVRIHDVLMEDDHPWIVMEYVRARSLDDLLRKHGALPVGEAARIGLALLDALRAVHALGILHRDVKPANILLEDDGQVVLADFGIATIDGDTRLTVSGELLGTVSYMAPERLNGRPEPGPASDLWSLGAVLYAAVEGHAPFQEESQVAVMAAILTQDAPPPRQAGPLGEVISGLLARSPDARPDAATAVRELAAVAGGVVPPGARAQVARMPSSGVEQTPSSGVVVGGGMDVVSGLEGTEADARYQRGHAPDTVSGDVRGAPTRVVARQHGSVARTRLELQEWAQGLLGCLLLALVVGLLVLLGAVGVL